MHIRKVLIELLVICTLLVSCSSTDEIGKAKQDLSNVSSSKISKTVEMKHYFKNDDVLIKVEPAGDRMYFTFTNYSNYRMVLHLNTAKVSVLGSDKTSNIVTFEQSKQNTSHFELTGVIVNPKETFSERYVALDAMNYDAYKTQSYIISEWASDNDFKLFITYGIATKNGEEMKNVVIN